MSSLAEEKDEGDWIKLDLHLHTLDDPKDVIDYSAHQLLERARFLGFRVLAITPPPWGFCSFRRRKFVYKAPM